MCFRNAVTAALRCPVLLYDDTGGMDVEKGILRECPSPCEMGENVTKVNSFCGRGLQSYLEEILLVNDVGCQIT